MLPENRTPSETCAFGFDIAAWHAVSERMGTPGQWQEWADDPAAAERFEPAPPSLSFLPAMQRRRLGRAARLVCAAGWDLADRFSGSPLVYASHDGELNRSFELWLELMRTHTVSPTSFGLSVHNALPGQWSMLRQDMREHTALAVSCDGLENALAEACALLAEGTESVLLILADDPLQAQYAVSARRAPFAYALAMVITAGSRYRIALRQSTPTASADAGPYWGALEWIRFMLSGSLSHTRDYGSRIWQWQKTA